MQAFQPPRRGIMDTLMAPGPLGVPNGVWLAGLGIGGYMLWSKREGFDTSGDQICIKDTGNMTSDYYKIFDIKKCPTETCYKCLKPGSTNYNDRKPCDSTYSVPSCVKHSTDPYGWDTWVPCDSTYTEKEKC